MLSIVSLSQDILGQAWDKRGTLGVYTLGKTGLYNLTPFYIDTQFCIEYGSLTGIAAVYTLVLLKMARHTICETSLLHVYSTVIEDTTNMEVLT